MVSSPGYFLVHWHRRKLCLEGLAISKVTFSYWLVIMEKELRLNPGQEVSPLKRMSIDFHGDIDRPQDDVTSEVISSSNGSLIIHKQRLASCHKMSSGSIRTQTCLPLLFNQERPHLQNVGTTCKRGVPWVPGPPIASNGRTGHVTQHDPR